MTSARGGAGDTGDAGDQLSDKRYVTIMLRLVLDRANRLVQGEFVDLNGQLLGRFASCTGLANALRQWLSAPPGGPAPS